MLNINDENFEGPLDLLLKLIEGNKLDITKISLSKITDSYLCEIEKLQCSSEEMAEFVVIATKLLYLKSKELLPNIETAEEEQDILDLEAALIEYQKYKQAANNLSSILEKGERSFRRTALIKKTITFTPPADVSQQKLWDIFNDLLSKIETKPESVTVAPVKISVEERRSEINKIVKKGQVSFRSLFAASSSKTEIIVTFLAILEMIKRKEISVKQKGNFTDFSLYRVK